MPKTLLLAEARRLIEEGRAPNLLAALKRGTPLVISEPESDAAFSLTELAQKIAADANIVARAQGLVNEDADLPAEAQALTDAATALQNAIAPAAPTPRRPPARRWRAA